MSMMQVYDLNQKKAIEVKDNDADKYLLLEGDRYVPVKGYKYMVVDEKSGEGQQVLGENLRAAMGDGKTLTSIDRYAVRKELQADRSQTGEFFKQMGNEALLLGLGDLSKDKPQNAFQEMIVEEEKNLFGKAHTAGTVAGTIAPFLAGGVGGLARLAGKGAAKAAVRTALKGAGKLPSSSIGMKLPLKAAEKGGEAFSKLAKGLGAGKTVQNVAKTAGTGAGLVGMHSALEGFKGGIREADKALSETKNFKGGERAMKVMDSAVGEGIETFKEVATSTAAVMGGLGVAGKFVKGTGWLTQKVATGIKELPKITADKARQGFFKAGGESFFNNRIANKHKENIAKSFGMKKDSKVGDVYRRAGEYLEKQFGKTPVNRTQAISQLQGHQDQVGKNIGGLRDSLKDVEVGAPGSFHSIQEPLRQIKKLVGGLEAGTTHKSFMNQVNFIEKKISQTVKSVVDKDPSLKRSLKALLSKKYKRVTDLRSAIKNSRLSDLEKKSLLGRIPTGRSEGQAINKLIEDMMLPSIKGKGLTFKDVGQILNIFKNGAKFAKGAEPTALNKTYRKAYGILSNWESKTADDLFNVYKKLKTKQGVSVNLKNLALEKKSYEINQSILDVINTPIKPGWGLSNYYALKDGLFIVAAGGGGGLIGGLGGVAAGAAVGAGAIAYVKSTGARLLHTANFMDKTHRIFKKVKTPQGVKNFFDKSSNTFKELSDRKPVSFSTLSFMMLGKSSKDFNEFDESLVAMNPIDKISTGQEDLYSSIEDYGGQANAQSFNENMAKTKKLILETKPKPYLESSTGKMKYSKSETDRWINGLDSVLTPEGFISSINKSSITLKKIQMFARLYPKFLTQLNLSLQQGIQNGTIKKTANIRRFLDLQRDNSMKDRVFYTLDAYQREQNLPPKNRKFSPKQMTTPSTSNYAMGGVMP